MSPIKESFIPPTFNRPKIDLTIHPPKPTNPKPIGVGMKRVVVAYTCGCHTENDVPDSKGDDTNTVCAKHRAGWWSICNYYPLTEAHRAPYPA